MDSAQSVVTNQQGVEHRLAHVMVPSGLEQVADRIKANVGYLSELTETDHRRTFRPLRFSEVVNVSNVSRSSVLRWRAKHLHELEHAKDASGDNGATASHIPFTLGEVHRLMADCGTLPRRPQGRRALRLGCFSFKGGVTKTTTMLNLACYYAINGWRVLVVDGDPQGSLSATFGYRPESTDPAHTLLPALSLSADGPVVLRQVTTHIDGLDLIPASLDMIGADFAVTSAFNEGGAQALRAYGCVARGLESLQDRYDLILLDSAPAFSFSAISLMWAADGMLIPVPPSAPDFKATGAFCAMAGSGLKQLCERAGVPHREWAPVVFLHNRVRPRSRSTDIILDMARDTFGHFLCSSAIQDSAAVPNALNLDMSVFEAQASQAGRRGIQAARSAYTEVAEQLLRAVRAAWDLGFAAAEAPP